VRLPDAWRPKKDEVLCALHEAEARQLAEPQLSDTGSKSNEIRRVVGESLGFEIRGLEPPSSALPLRTA
jgi:hypothetical protein